MSAESLHPIVVERTWPRRSLALVMGVIAHGSFAIAIGLMAYALAFGMRLPEGISLGTATGTQAWGLNALLVVQFPLLHSWLLTTRGGCALTRLVPIGRVWIAGRALTYGQVLAPTLYATVAAWQLALTFLCWSPLSAWTWQPTGGLALAWWGAFVCAWLFLVRALHDAGLGLQTGWIGWTALWRGTAPRYPRMPQTGLFLRSRQPIYLGFAMVLCSGPVWTLDHCVIASAWTTYCVLGPLLKERRFGTRYGADFEAYRRRVPYFFPQLHS